jgi:hypothetical protein
MEINMLGTKANLLEGITVMALASPATPTEFLEPATIGFTQTAC